MNKKQEIRQFVEDNIPVIHKSGRTKRIESVFTSKKAQYEVVKMLTDGIYNELVNINIIR